MSLHSTIAMAIKKTDYEAMLNDINERHFVNPEQAKNFIEQGLANAPKCPAEDYVFLEWRDVRWFLDVEVVDYIEDCKMWFEDYDFVKLGEELDDNEYELLVRLIGIKRVIEYGS